MKKILFVLALLFCVSCATLPKATVELSTVLGSEIEMLEKQHMSLLEKYFKQRREEVLSFLNHDWYPRYLNNFFKEEEMVKTLDEISNTPDISERADKIKTLMIMMQEDYMIKHKEFMEPVENAENNLRALISGRYSQAKRINLTITNNVESVNDIQNKRKEYLYKVAGSKVLDVKYIEEGIAKITQDLDEVLNKLKTNN